MLDQMKEQMQSGQICDEEDYQFATEMLARIPPDGPEPMQYCVEVITIIALRLRNGELLEHVRQYDKSVAEMDEPQRRHLADRLSDVSKLLTEIQTAQPRPPSTAA